MEAVTGVGGADCSDGLWRQQTPLLRQMAVANPMGAAGGSGGEHGSGGPGCGGRRRRATAANLWTAAVMDVDLRLFLMLWWDCGFKIGGRKSS